MVEVMSERSEIEYSITRPRVGSIPLSVLIEFIGQKVYTDLMRLVDLLPSKTDIEKKIEIATFFSRTRHLFIRLEALIKWSNGASKVDKCEKISNFLEEQSLFLISTANFLSRLLRETLISARLPPFAVLLAIDIFTNKSYTRLPKSIKNIAVPNDPISNRELKQALLDLNRIIQNRLSLTQIPRQFKTIKISNGRVYFVVPHEFRVSLTLMSEAVDFPWRILEVIFLVKDPVSNYHSLVHPLQTQFIETHVQSRILYRNFDKRPPLIHLYDMLHAFSLSLQLDVFHEQAQRARIKRPSDQLVVEAYRPGHSLSISYWHCLSHNQFQAVMGTDGKLYPTAYLLTIHVDPLDSQRPLCVTHRPELPATEVHRIGTVIQGSGLSMEKLLARTITARAEQLLQDLRQELMVLSAGPVCLADAPLCLYFPLLWPCHPQEFLQICVDPTHGTISAWLPLLTNSEAETFLPGPSQPTQTVQPGVFDGFTQASVFAAMTSLEAAFNRPSVRRIRPANSSGSTFSMMASESLVASQSKSLRTLSHCETRWLSIIRQSLDHLRVCLALARLAKTANCYRPFWQPVKRCLPLILSPTQANATTNWASDLFRIQQSLRWPMIFVQLFPYNDYYLVCEVYNESLSVGYRYYLLVATVLPDTTEIIMDTNGLMVSTLNSTRSILGIQSPGTSLYMQATHFVAIDASSVWTHNPSCSIPLIKSCVERAQSNLARKRTARLNELLARIKDGTGNKINYSSSSTFSHLDHGPVTPASRPTLTNAHVIVPTLTRLIGHLEESILTKCLSLELSRVGIKHHDVCKDGAGALSAIKLTSFKPFKPPNWQPPDVIPLSDCVYEVVLRPQFDPFTYQRSLQLDLLFAGFPTPNQTEQPTSTVIRRDPNNLLRYQTVEWPITRLNDLGAVAKNVLQEWNNLCHMHALCYPAIVNPDANLADGVQVHSYTLRTMSLKYGDSAYLADISFKPDRGFTLSLSYNPAIMDYSRKHAFSTGVESNPHQIAQQHLEEILNSTKSLLVFSKVLIDSLHFLRALESVQDAVVTNQDLKSFLSGSLLSHTVRGITLLSLSVFDFILVYRGCLSVRLSYVPVSGQSVRSSPFPASYTDDGVPGQETIFLTDAYEQIIDRGWSSTRVDGSGELAWPNQLNLGNDEVVFNNPSPLPAFQRFLSYFADANSFRGLTVAQVIKIISPCEVNPTPNKLKGHHSRYPPLFGKSCRPISQLESYLSASLLFQSAILSIIKLNIPLLRTDPADLNFDKTEAGEESGPPSLIELVRAGAFACHWSNSNITSQLHLSCQRSHNMENSLSWTVMLRLSPTPSLAVANSVGADHWPPETLRILEEFFALRVSAPPYHPSTIASFFRLLALPVRALRSVVRLLPIDLHTPTHSPIQLRLGLIATTSRHSTARANPVNCSPTTTAAESNLINSHDYFPCGPGVVLRPPRVILQLLIVRLSQRTQSKYIQSVAQRILVSFDWDANHVTVLWNWSPSSTASGTSQTGSSSRPELTSNNAVLQLLRDADVENNANMMASNSGDSALVHLLKLITQTLASSGPSVSGHVSGSLAVPPHPGGPSKVLFG